MPEQVAADRVAAFLDAMQDDGLGGEGTLLLGWFGPDSEHLERLALNAVDLRVLLDERDRLLKDRDYAVKVLGWIEDRASAKKPPLQQAHYRLRGIYTSAKTLLEALVKSSQTS